MTYMCKDVGYALLHLIALKRVILVGEEIQGAIRKVCRAAQGTQRRRYKYRARSDVSVARMSKHAHTGS